MILFSFYFYSIWKRNTKWERLSSFPKRSGQLGLGHAIARSWELTCGLPQGGRVPKQQNHRGGEQARSHKQITKFREPVAYHHNSAKTNHNIKGQQLISQNETVTAPPATSREIQVFLFWLFCPTPSPATCYLPQWVWTQSWNQKFSWDANPSSTACQTPIPTV